MLKKKKQVPQSRSHGSLLPLAWERRIVGIALVKTMGILDQLKATHVIHTTSRLAVITGIRVCVVVLVLLT